MRGRRGLWWGEWLELESPESRDSLMFALTPSAAGPVPGGWMVGTPELGATRLWKEIKDKHDNLLWERREVPVKLFRRREVVSGGCLGRVGAGYSQQRGLEMTHGFCLLAEDRAGSGVLLVQVSSHFAFLRQKILGDHCLCLPI